MRTPYAVIAVLLAVLVPIGFLTDDGAGGTRAGGHRTPVRTIAERVEAIRGLRYRAVPRPQRVTAATATREGVADLDRGYPVARRHADEALDTLLGLLPAGTDLRAVNRSVYGEQVAGYYDPTRERLRIVTGAGTANRVLDEMTIAHELDHALEDQAIGFRTALSDRTDDAGLAYKALLEGSATAVMYDYLARHFKTDVALGGLLGGSFAAGSTSGLPRFVLDGLTFPYVGGQAFVAALRRRAGGRWTLVDLAERVRPPVSSEQVLHPRQVDRGRGPRPGAAAAPGGRARAGLAPAHRGDLRRVGDGRVAVDRRRPGRTRGGRLGRRPLRAVAPRDRALRGAVPGTRRARAALALGHRGGRRAVPPGRAAGAA